MKLVYSGLGLLFLGIIIMIIASIASPTSTTITTQPTTSGGFAGVVFIGPFPIVFGVGSPSQLPYLFTFGIIFTIIAVLLFFILPLIMYRKSQSRF